MPRKLRLDGLRAELNSVLDILRQSHGAGDPVGELQYKHRQNILEKEIEEIEKTITTSASVALFFGGKPVLGSRGISAEFAGGVLEKFQDLVTRTFAKTEVGQLGKRGPIPQKEDAQLMITELARGSFGFILDEMSDQTENQETALKLMVDEVARIVEETGSPNEPDFEEMVESLDPRTLIALKDFFTILDNSEATIRIVEDGRDFILDKYAIHRGRLRTEATLIEEKEDYTSGKLLGFLPEHRKFELKPVDSEIVYGSVSKEAAEQYQTMISSGNDVVGRNWQVKLTVRTVKPLNRPSREVYRLIEFMNEIKVDV
jgi:hypothetical protein